MNTTEQPNKHETHRTINNRRDQVGRRNKRAGFTLVEIMIVSVIIGGIIAAVAVPVFQTIRRNQRIDNTRNMLVQYESAVSNFESNGGGNVYPLTVVTAAPGASIASGTLANATATAFSNATRFEMVLKGAGLIKTEFRPQMGDQNFVPNGWTATASDITWSPTTKLYSITPDTATPALDYSNVSRLICSLSTATTPSTAAGSNFRLPENNGADMPTNVRVVAAIIKNANAQDAYELAKKYNPTLLDATTYGSAQDRGRVTFKAAVNGVTDVNVFLGYL